MKKIVNILALVSLFIAVGVRAEIVTNYVHSFSGSVEDALHGTAPDVRPGNETFNANAVFKADGSFDWDGSVVPRGVAIVPLTIEAGLIYTASLDVHFVSSAHDNHSIGLSFWTAQGGTAHSPLGTTQQEATLLLRYQGGGRLYAYGDYKENANNFIYASGLGVGLTQTLSMKLFTYEDETPWKVEYFMGETMVHDLTFAEAPEITHFAIGSGHGNTSALSGTMDNFSITAIPEPATLGMLAVTLMGILFLRRLRS